MKILFLCGSLEPGKDGVGDYTRKLAEELVKLEQTVLLVSLNDKHVENTIQEIQVLNKSEIEIFRFSYNQDWVEKIEALQSIIAVFKPDWVSLQFVSYSFNEKGLPFNFVRQLKQIDKKLSWHIMFHEIWIGFTKISSIKHRAVGFFQKRFVKQLIKNIPNPFITTTNVLYNQVLKNANIESDILPLFSNITVLNNSQSKILEIIQKDSGLRDLSKHVIIGIFGTLYPEVRLEEILRQEIDKAKINNKTLLFISIGRAGIYGQIELERLKRLYSKEAMVVSLGEQTAADVSTVLQLFDKAISCTPAQHAGKSGAFAALRLHNIPVMFPVFDIIPEYNEIIQVNHQKLLDKQPFEWSAGHIASTFLSFLNQKKM